MTDRQIDACIKLCLAALPTTGLLNAGAASDEGKTLKHWREIAGLTDDDDTKKEG